MSAFAIAGATLVPLDRAELANRARGPAQVGVSPSGDTLVVTEKSEQLRRHLPLDGDGLPGPATCNPSAGQTPFGFGFAAPDRDLFGNRYDVLVVSEAAGGAPNASTVSSYLVANGAAAPLAAAVRTENTAACWIAIAGGGRYVYTTVAGSDAVSGFRLHEDGALRLLAADGKSAGTGAGSHPTDEAVAGDHLFVLDSGTGALSSFAIRGDGRLVPAATATDLPASAAGLAAR